MTFVNLLIFLLVLGTTGALLVTVLTALLTRAILCPPRMTDGKAVSRLQRLSPGDLGLIFDYERFSVRDESGRALNIASWWIPAAHPSGRCAVLIHGYADAKVGSIAWAPVLHQAGLNILAIDLRAHGESGGTYSTGGFFERDDLNQVIDQLLTTRPGETEQLVLFGVSLGAAVAAAVAASRSDIFAVILESPFTGYRRAIAAHSDLGGTPRGPILQAAIACAQWITTAKFDAVRPIDTIPQIRCPVLTIIGDDDAMLTAQDIADLRAAVDQQANPASQFWLVEGADHLMASQTQPLLYRKTVENFLASIPINPPERSTVKNST